MIGPRLFTQTGLRRIFPREGGILALWLSSAAMGLSFLVGSGRLPAGILYLAGSLCFLASVQTGTELTRSWKGKKRISLRFLVPPLLGLAAWGPILAGYAIAVFALFVAALAFVALRAVEGKEREWQTRVSFAGAALMMMLLGLSVSGADYTIPLVVLIFALPFSFFSSQELFVQRIADAHLPGRKDPSSPGFRTRSSSGAAALYFFLGSYAAASFATASLADSIAAPVIFALFLLSFPVVWLSSKGRINFRRLGLEQASLDAMMTMAVIALFLAAR